MFIDCKTRDGTEYYTLSLQHLHHLELRVSRLNWQNFILTVLGRFSLSHSLGLKSLEESDYKVRPLFLVQRGGCGYAHMRVENTSSPRG